VSASEEINHAHALMVEYFASTVTLEVVWQALFNSATHVHKGMVVSLQQPFLFSLIEIHIDLLKY
jgi:hypothetical protein